MSIVNDFSTALADAVERAAAFVVAVHGHHRIPASGVHWRHGIFVTADHTVERDDQVDLTLPDGRRTTATLVGRDPTTDLAVLRADGDSLAVAGANSELGVKVGNIVLAVARPSDSGVRASVGVMSAVGPAWNTWRGGRIDAFLRPDLELYYGFSGGPLVDVESRVFGINTSGLSRHFDLTIPTSTVNRVVDQLLARGRIARGYLGLSMQPVRLPASIATALRLTGGSGVIVVSVEPGSPAEKAGVMLGDVIVELDGSEVEDTADVLATLGPEKVGTKIRGRAVRGGQLVELVLTVGERPSHWE